MTPPVHSTHPFRVEMGVYDHEGTKNAAFEMHERMQDFHAFSRHDASGSVWAAVMDGAGGKMRGHQQAGMQAARAAREVALTHFDTWAKLGIAPEEKDWHLLAARADVRNQELKEELDAARGNGEEPFSPITTMSAVGLTPHPKGFEIDTMNVGDSGVLLLSRDPASRRYVAQVLTRLHNISFENRHNELKNDDRIAALAAQRGSEGERFLRTLAAERMHEKPESETDARVERSRRAVLRHAISAKLKVPVPEDERTEGGPEFEDHKFRLDPDIENHGVAVPDDLLLNTTDGLLDIFSPKEIEDRVNAYHDENHAVTPQEIAQRLVLDAYAKAFKEKPERIDNLKLQVLKIIKK